MRAISLVMAFMVALAATLHVAEPVHAAEPVRGAAALDMRRINLAGRQRMLSQRIAGAVCLARLGAEPELNAEKAREATALFGHTLVVLRKGDPSRSLPPETRPEVLAALAKIDRLWPEFRDTVAGMLDAGGTTAPPVSRLQATTARILRASNDAVGVLEQAGTGGDHALKAAINLAGRQRMLIQKSIMEACFATLREEDGASGRGQAAALLGRVNDNRVAKTAAQFEESLAWLLTGNPRLGISPPPTPAVDDALLRVVRMWRWLSPDLDRVRAGERIGAGRLALLGRAADVVTARMNDAVTLYERS